MERFCFDADWDFVLFGPTVFHVGVLDVEVILELVLFRTTECDVDDVFVLLLDDELGRTQGELGFFRVCVDKVDFDRDLARVFDFDLSG